VLSPSKFSDELRGPRHDFHTGRPSVGGVGDARSIGMPHVRELTVRRKEGPLLTSLATGDASSKLVEAYRLHPNAIKALARCGQGYLLSDEGLSPVAYGMLPPLNADYPLPTKDQRRARGLRLYETFVVG
jgi:hypothetical protein